MAETQRSYVPAAGRHIFLPFYDSLTRLIGADKARRSLLEQAELRAGQRALDVGCGTGSLLVQLKRREPRVDAVGIDPDPNALARARRKAERARVSIRLDQGFADSLPYADASFDRVLSSLMFHHLPRREKNGALSEIRRVLGPNGRLELMDFAGHAHADEGRLHRWLHAHPRLEDNAESDVLALLTEASFGDARVVGRARMLLGNVLFYRASR
jgi:ubiquinone/menaquinone biosynthesis C-methylase UbiE